MTSTVKLSTIVEYTGLSPRYWQRRVAAGEVPGARELPCGARRVFWTARRLKLPSNSGIYEAMLYVLSRYNQP